MTKVKVTISSKARLKITKKPIEAVEQVLLDDEVLQEIDRVLVKQIRGNLRLGKDLEGKPIRKIKKESLDNRVKLWSYGNERGTSASATKSNLTITGQFLNSLGVFRVGAKKFVVGYKGQRQGYLNKSGKRGDAPSNEKLQEWFLDKGFNILEFNYSNKKIVDQLRTAIARVVAKLLRSKYKIKK